MRKEPLYFVIILIIISLIPIVYSISASASIPRAILEAEVDEGDTEEIIKTLTFPNVNDVDVSTKWNGATAVLDISIDV